jgi:hypothetical protein
MNLVLETLGTLIVTTVGIYLTQRIQHDYKLVKIFKNYPIPSTLRVDGIIDLEKLYIFVQNFKYEIEMRGNVNIETSGHMVKVVSGPGEIVITLSAWGYLDFYIIRRTVKIII